MNTIFSRLIQSSIVSLVLLLLGFSNADAEETSQFHLNASQTIVYCDITPSFNQKNIIQTLQEGTEILFSWHISIEHIQPYWLNQSVADIHFNRQVIPDLLTQQWTLNDSLTDIPTYTLSISKAVEFLSHIHQFPIIDKSLLAPHNAYLITVSLNIKKGHQDDGWWHDIWHGEHHIASSILNLP
ncbi:MAG: DUF4390 domain-containing protein [Mariprofundaceae bacterium]|nr:DUF4390 domain-containing protein [Mariprofundaceae bacterium]